MLGLLAAGRNRASNPLSGRSSNPHVGSGKGGKLEVKLQPRAKFKKAVSKLMSINQGKEGRGLGLGSGLVA